MFYISSLGDYYKQVERFRGLGEKNNKRHPFERPITACSSADIEQVQALIEYNLRINLSDIEAMTSLSRELQLI